MNLICDNLPYLRGECTIKIDVCVIFSVDILLKNAIILFAAVCAGGRISHLGDAVAEGGTPPKPCALSSAG